MAEHPVAIGRHRRRPGLIDWKRYTQRRWSLEIPIRPGFLFPDFNFVIGRDRRGQRFRWFSTLLGAPSGLLFIFIHYTGFAGQKLRRIQLFLCNRASAPFNLNICLRTIRDNDVNRLHTNDSFANAAGENEMFHINARINTPPRLESDTGSVVFTGAPVNAAFHDKGAI